MQRKWRLCPGTSLDGTVFRCQEIEEECLDVLEICRGKLDRPGCHPGNFTQALAQMHFFCVLIKKERKVSNSIKSVK